MMRAIFTLSSFLIYFIASSYCEAKSLNDVWSPCAFEDSDCDVTLWQTAVKHLAAGSTELGVPPLDPLRLDNIDVNVPGLIYLHFDGLMRGLKACNFDSAHKTIKKGHFSLALDLHCNVSLKGNYNVTANTSVLFGPGNDGLLKADGTGKVKLDDLGFKFVLDVDLKRDVDGIIKFRLRKGPIGYAYKIGGPVQFAASKISLWNEDITKFVVSFMNLNWKLVMNIFGDFFFQKAMEIISEFPRAVIDATPASYFYLDDMQQYL